MKEYWTKDKAGQNYEPRGILGLNEEEPVT